jgi:large subunit ribosomal protein L22
MADKKTRKGETASPEATAAAAPGRKRGAKRAAKAAAGPHASLSYLRIAPRKVRLVAAHVRGLAVGEALAMLKYTPQSAAKPLAKLLRSAVANAEDKGGHVDVDALFVKTLTVDGGPKLRRFMPRAMGRAYRVEKRTSHVYVELGTGARA